MKIVLKYFGGIKKLLLGAFAMLVFLVAAEINVRANVESNGVRSEFQSSEMPTLSSADRFLDFLFNPLQTPVCVLPITDETFDEQDEKETSESKCSSKHLGYFIDSSELVGRNASVKSIRYKRTLFNRVRISLLVLHHSWKSDLI